VGKPKGIKISSNDDRSGIVVEYVRRRRVLGLYGWYDNFVGIEGDEIALGDFLKRLGITVDDVRKELGT